MHNFNHLTNQEYWTFIYEGLSGTKQQVVLHFPLKIKPEEKKGL